MQQWLSKYTNHIKHCYHQEQYRIKKHTHDIRKWTVKLKKTTSIPKNNLRKQVTKVQASLKTFFSNPTHTTNLTQASRLSPTTSTRSQSSKKQVPHQPRLMNPQHKYLQTMLKLRRPQSLEKTQEQIVPAPRQEITDRKVQPTRYPGKNQKSATIIQNNNTGTILSKIVKKFERWKEVHKNQPETKVKTIEDIQLNHFSYK